MTGAFKLTIAEGEKKSRSYALAKFPFVIGRAAGNDIVLEDKRVSRQHASITFESGECMIRDLSSQNGTWVNGKKITHCALKAGDTLLIGGHSLLVDTEKTDDIFSDEHSPGMKTTIQRAKDILRDSITAPIDDSSIDLLKRRNSMLSALYHLSKSILRESEIGPILEQTADIVLDTIRAERVYVLMQEGGDGSLRPVVCRQRGASSDCSGKLGEPGYDRLMFSRTLIHKVMDEAVSLLVADAGRDERFRESESIFMYGIRSAMCVPLLGTTRVIGTVYADILHTERKFTEDDLNLFTTIGNLAAMVIEQANLRDEIRRETEARKSLMRYHSPQVVEEIIRGKGSCEVQERTISVLFTDIVGFTSLSEELGPMETALLLGGYFDTITEIVFRYGGSIDKFIGDAAMAIFGAPFQDHAHIENAVKAAIEIQREICRDGRFQVRIGINTGPAVIGNIGSSKRAEYTAIGDTVNIASRLEKMAGPGEIYISGSVHDRIRNSFRTRGIGKQKVKGKSMEVDVYEVAGE